MAQHSPCTKIPTQLTHSHRSVLSLTDHLTRLTDQLSPHTHSTRHPSGTNIHPDSQPDRQPHHTHLATRDNFESPSHERAPHPASAPEFRAAASGARGWRVHVIRASGRVGETAGLRLCRAGVGGWSPRGPTPGRLKSAVPVPPDLTGSLPSPVLSAYTDRRPPPRRAHRSPAALECPVPAQQTPLGSHSHMSIRSHT